MKLTLQMISMSYDFGERQKGLEKVFCFNWKRFRRIFNYTTRTTAAIMIIFSCGVLFSVLLTMLRLPDKLAEFTVASGLSGWGVVILFCFVLLVLGMFVDGATAVVVTTPIVLPTIISSGYGPLWWGIILVLNLEMAVITQPVGLNLYAIKSIAEDITLEDIIRGSFPFFLVEMICLGLFIAFKDLALWLPGLME